MLGKGTRENLVRLNILGFGLLTGLVVNRLISGAFASDSNVLRTRGIQIEDQNKKLRAQLETAGGGVALWLYDEAGQVRLSAGIYGEGSERGQSYLSLSNPKGEVVGLLRSVGPNDSPVLVFKSNGKDRLITGLNFSTPAQEPFLVRLGESGDRVTSFGTYP